MTQQRLKCFVAVAETLNFSKASEMLFISQPALSRQIEKLEDELQCRLFQRDKRSVQLTRDGIICLRYARGILDAYDNLEEALKLSRSALSGTLHLGYGGRSHLKYITAGLKKLRVANPLIHVDIRKDHIEGLKWGLRTGMDDAIIIFEPCIDPEWMAWKLIEKQQMDAILPADHPLAQAESIPLIALRDERFVTSSRANHPQIYDTRLSLCAQAGFSPRIQRVVKTAEAAAIEVGTNGFVTLLPKSAIDPSLPNIRVVSIEGLEGTFNVVLAWKKGNENPGIQLLHQHLSFIAPDNFLA